MQDFTGRERDEDELKDELCTESEFQGILANALSYYSMACISGKNSKGKFTISDSSVEASEEYMDRNDAVMPFIRDHITDLVTGVSDQRVYAEDVYTLYKKGWCAKNDKYVVEYNSFNRSIRQHTNANQKRSNSKIYWLDIAIKNEDALDNMVIEHQPYKLDS